MSDLSVALPSLNGFAADLRDSQACSTSNAARLLPAVALPAESTGLISTLARAAEKFRNAVGTELSAEASAVELLGTNLSTAAGRFAQTEDASTAGLSGTPGSSIAVSAPLNGDEGGVSRFGGLQLPSLAEVTEEPRTIRRLVQSVIEALSVYDDRVSSATGLRPTIDLLTPLAADWEAVRAIGKRIGLLGINDYVTQGNLASGTNWLMGFWSGAAAQSFAASSTALAQTTGARSLDFEAVSKTVEAGGAYIERLVYNQAADLCERILQPMSFLGATFPLGAWAPYIDKPINSAMRSEISAGLQSLETETSSRQQRIQAAVDKVAAVLDYIPKRSTPSLVGTEFDLPNKIAVGLGVRRFGYGDTVWWEDRFDAIF
ncbi:hypothetical protein AB0H71_10485 [Nocardia sp. NPDC050697]|uniref:hypothetical protein n=1 Tax=Nocardia sp. NPDC050697 TaxID=3155158 RepID=UPI0033EE1BE1